MFEGTCLLLKPSLQLLVLLVIPYQDSESAFHIGAHREDYFLNIPPKCQPNPLAHSNLLPTSQIQTHAGSKLQADLANPATMPSL